MIDNADLTSADTKCM